MFTVSNSRIKMYRSCHFAHYVKYVMNLVPKTKGEPFQRGGLIHSCLENYHNGKSWKKTITKFGKEFYEKTFAEERVILGDIPKMVYNLMDSYFEYYKDDEEPRIATELHFQIPLTDSIEVEGYIDALTGEKSAVWPWEYKSYSRMPNLEFMIFNAQSGIYNWALQEMGYTPLGTIWDIIKAKEPSLPTLTERTKKLSLAHLDSTPWAVRQGIIGLGLNPEDYIDFINSHRYEDFFIRHKVRLQRDVVVDIMRDVKSTAIDIYNNGEKRRDKNLNRNCSWCSYKSICMAQINNLDVKFIIEKQFMKREEKKVENETEEE